MKMLMCKLNARGEENDKPIYIERELEECTLFCIVQIGYNPPADQLQRWGPCSD
jgi:hypothetical protein